VADRGLWPPKIGRANRRPACPLEAGGAAIRRTALVLDAIQRQPGEFSVADLQKECPGVSLDMIRHLLDRLRKDKKVKCLGTGRNARWQNLGN